MIAVTFLVRIAKFAFSFAILAAAILLVYWLVSKVFMLFVDRIAASNREFFVWLRGKWPFVKIISRRNSKNERTAP